MPLTPMYDDVSNYENAKLAIGYGLPNRYPLGINGFGAGDEIAASAQAFTDVFLPPSAGYSSADPQSPNYGRQSNFTFEKPQSLAPWVPGSVPSDKNQNNANQPNQSQTKFGQKVQDIVNPLSAAIAQLLPVFKGNKRPKQKVIVQKDPPDNTVTYAVIGGAVIVASILAIAVAKSGSRSTSQRA